MGKLDGALSLATGLVWGAPAQGTGLELDEL